MSRGHVYVVHGDLTRLACDDIVVPTDRFLATSAHWHDVVPADLRVDGLGVSSEEWSERRWVSVPSREGVWLVDTGGASSREISLVRPRSPPGPGRRGPSP